MSLGAGMVRRTDHRPTVPVLYCFVFLSPRLVTSDNQMYLYYESDELIENFK